MRTLLALAAAATVLATVSAIKCYECNSHLSQACKDLTSPEAEKFLKDCGDHKDGHKYTLCRKLDIYLDMDFGKDHPAENRIHRACGYEEDKDKRSCYYKSGYNTRTWVCACKDDGCNAAHLPSAAPALLPLAALAVVLRGVY